MRLSSSTTDSDSSAPFHPGDGQEDSRTEPTMLGERSVIGLTLVRLFVGLPWFQQLFWKLPPDFVGLRKYVIEEEKYTLLPGYAFVIQRLFLPNFLVLGALTWLAELVVALCLLFGVFSRFGALLSVLLAAQLYVGLTYAPGEWYWTYGMLVLLGVVLTLLPTGRRLGADQWLFPQLQITARTNWIARLLLWFV